MRRALVSVLCASLLACSQQSVLPGATAGGLAAAREQDDGTVRLVDERGEAVLLRPDDTLRVTTVDEATTTLAGREVCRSAAGLARRKGGGSCAGAARVAGWDEIASIEVDQFDGAATVGVTTAVAILVVGVVLMTLGSKGGGGTSIPGGGGGGGKSRPRPGAPRPPRVASAARGGGHLVGVSVRPALLVDAGAPAYGPEASAPSPLARTSAGAEPLFSGETARRATVSPSLRLDLSACVAGERCLAQSVRVGLLMADLVEVSGGLRAEQDGARTSWLGVVGMGLQGRFTGAPSMSIALGTQLALGGDDMRVLPGAGLRFEPARGTVVGLMPLALTYFQQKERVAYTPSIDLGYQF